MAGGRPSKYKEEYCERLIKHMATGLPYETFAAEIGVSRDVLYDWEKKHPEFLHAKKRARDMQYKALATTGMAGMVGKITIVTNRKTRTVTRKINGEEVSETIVEETFAPGFNATAWIFFMKNCFGWRDIIEISEDDEVDSMDFEGK